MGFKFNLSLSSKAAIYSLRVKLIINLNNSGLQLSQYFNLILFFQEFILD